MGWKVWKLEPGKVWNFEKFVSNLISPHYSLVSQIYQTFKLCVPSSVFRLNLQLNPCPAVCVRSHWPQCVCVCVCLALARVLCLVTHSVTDSRPVVSGWLWGVCNSRGRFLTHIRTCLGHTQQLAGLSPGWAHHCSSLCVCLHSQLSSGPHNAEHEGTRIWFPRHYCSERSVCKSRAWTTFKLVCLIRL